MIWLVFYQLKNNHIAKENISKVKQLDKNKTKVKNKLMNGSLNN